MLSRIFLFCGVLFCCVISAQVTTFQSTYSLQAAPAYSSRTNTICTQDGGFLCPVIERSDQLSYEGHLIVLKTASDGNLVWAKRLNAISTSLVGFTNGFCAELSDGSYVVTTQLIPVPPSSLYSIVVLRVDVGGNLIWQRSFQGDFLNVSSVVVMTNGDIVTTGSIANSSSESDYWAGCLTSAGNYLWSKTFNLGPDGERANSACQAPNGNILIAGSSTIGLSKMSAALITGSGNLLWGKLFDGPIDDEATEVKPLTNGDFILAGRAGNPAPNTGCWDITATRITSAGNIVWSWYYGGDECDEGYSVVENADGTLVFGCEPESFISASQSALMKTTANGDFIWMKTYVGASGTFPNSLTKTQDGGYVLSGVRGNFFSTASPFFINKTDGNGDVVCGAQSVTVHQMNYNLTATSGGTANPGNAPVTENYQWSSEGTGVTNECDGAILNAPNVFTPDEDGINDLYIPTIMDGLPYHIWIYDRWGVLMFESIDGVSHWDGYTRNGQPATDGTYYYIVEAASLTFNGFFTLIR